jgi:hypothetical protein
MQEKMIAKLAQGRSLSCHPAGKINSIKELIFFKSWVQIWKPNMEAKRLYIDLKRTA